MVKNIWMAFLLFLLHFEITIEETLTCSGIVSSTQECLDKLTEEEDEYNFKCCHVTANKRDGSTVSECQLLAEEEHKNIKEFKNSLKDDGYQDPKVDCKSNYLQITLLTLLLFVL